MLQHERRDLEKLRERYESYASGDGGGAPGGGGNWSAGESAIAEHLRNASAALAPAADPAAGAAAAATAVSALVEQIQTLEERYHTAQFNILGLLFFSLLFVIFGIQQMIPTIFEERLLFYRERSAGAYGSAAYTLSSVAALSPITALNSALYCAVLAPMANLAFAERGFFLLVVALTQQVALFFCQFLASCVPHAGAAIAVYPAAAFFLLAYGGFIIQLPHLMPTLRCWAPSVSFARWAFQSLVISQFPPSRHPHDPVSIDEVVLATRLRKLNDFLLHDYGFEDFSKWDGVYFLLGNAVIFRLLTYLATRFINFERR